MYDEFDVEELNWSGESPGINPIGLSWSGEYETFFINVCVQHQCLTLQIRFWKNGRISGVK